ncbi:hypothetical protein GCM10022232_80910 [Streptomyces plumbiresistens]|uniref:Uncharacterized protein n=1 Tax=Streptomyces plumbiresistens TaxID=511811 RepID=A0ABP7TAW5_9ACTN
MTEALGEHGPVLHRDDGDEQERKQAQDLADPADREATGEFGELGELYRCHIRRGFPPRTNCGLRKRGQGIAYGHRILRAGDEGWGDEGWGTSGVDDGREDDGSTLTSIMLEVLRSFP